MGALLLSTFCLLNGIKGMSSSSVQNKTPVVEPGDEGSIAPISIKRGHERCHRFHAVLENFVLYVLLSCPCNFSHRFLRIWGIYGCLMFCALILYPRSIL